MPIKIVWAWHGKKFSGMMIGTMGNRLEEAATFLERNMKDSVSILFPPPSRAGEPPRMRTGQLHDAITHETKRLVARIGIATEEDCPYAKFLEVGTKSMGPRPFIRLTLIRNLKRIMTMLGRPVDMRVAVNLRP